MNILGLTSTGEQAPKPFKGAAPVVKDLSGNKWVVEGKIESIWAVVNL